MPKDVGGGIMEAAGDSGRQQHRSEPGDYTQIQLLQSRPSVAGDEAVRDPGGSPRRTLSAKPKSLS